jgi:hypothetical protein
MQEAIELNATEEALLKEIVWEPISDDHEAFVANSQRAAALTESLLKRKGIPKIRVAYLSDPSMNIGGYGKSRNEWFEKNGCRGDALFRHPDFLKYLKYFVNGPDLPKDTIRGFCQIIEKDSGTSSMVLEAAKAFVRKEIREKGLNKRHSAEEFFKLAHEIKRPDLAVAIRSAAMGVRDK